MSRNAMREPAAIGTPAARILDELDEVVRKSCRRAALRRPLRNAGTAFAGLLSWMVPKVPPQYDLPPEFLFPFF